MVVSARQAAGQEHNLSRLRLVAVLSGKRFGEAVCGLESMPWVLDVNFCEDESRTRERILGNNLSGLRQFAVTLLKCHPNKNSLANQ